MIRITLLDNFDPFTYNLVEQFCLFGMEVWVMCNDALLPMVQAALPADGCKLLVLSLGSGQSEDAGCMLESLAWARGRLPVPDVCLGHQALALTTDDAVGEARKSLHGKSTPLRFDQHHPPFNGTADLHVACYHSLVVSRLPGGFDCLANVGSEIMAMADLRNQQLGLQFHPEPILTTHGQCLLENTLSWCGAPAVHGRLRV